MAIVPWIKYENIHCKNCIYYTGVQCHGHGEFYGTCNLAEKILKMLELETNKILVMDKLPEYVNDDSICPFVKEWKGRKEDNETKKTK